MNNPNPATPPQGATPGSDAQNNNQPPVVTPAPQQGPQGNNQEGQITITAKEYRDLQRAKARTLSFDKRINLNLNKNQTTKTNDDGEGSDPELVERLASSEEARQAAERRALQAEVGSKVRDILDKDEFKAIPKSTRELILKNPAMLSKADNLEEALLDIEDFLRENVIGIDSVPIPMPQNNAGQKNETPPVINSGAPAPVEAAGLEDVSKLTGTARSQAMIRNKMREARGVKAV